MATQGFFDPPPRRTVAVVLAALVVLAVVVAGPGWRALRRDGSRSSSPPASHTLLELTSLCTAADAGDDVALRSLTDALKHWTSPDAPTLVSDMLRSTRAEVRAAACEWIGRHAQSQSQPNLTPLLFTRMSDADWRVRAAAFDAMERIGASYAAPPGSPTPLRDTPVDQREEVVFAWINSWRDATGQTALDHCELYAAAGGHWLTGTKLAQSCLSCHAPPDAHATVAFERCADCHRAAHAEWSASAHARSTTHLNLARVDESTKRVERYEVGPREGLVCTSCHVPAPADSEAAPVPAGTEDLFIAHRFQPNAAASCATCHAETHGEWEAWRTGARPIASRWLPGEFAWDESPDERTCVSCHMSERNTRTGGLVHAFAARRDASLMRGGLSAHLEPPTAGRGPQLVLTNLAGHRYPSGTVRRALRIELQYDTFPESAPRLLARLTDWPIPTTQPTQPTLAPGEQRRLELPVVAGASRVTCTITFERNQFEPGSYELPLHVLKERMTTSVPASE